MGPEHNKRGKNRRLDDVSAGVEAGRGEGGTVGNPHHVSQEETKPLSLPVSKLTIPVSPRDVQSPPISSEGPQRSEKIIITAPVVSDHSANTSLALLESVATESLAFAANAPTSVQTQLSRLLAIIQKPVVDVLQLRGVVLASGLPPHRFCAPSLRSLIWKLLLGVIPPVRNEWMSYLEEKRKMYDQYVFDLVQEPEEVSNLRFGAVGSPSEGAVRRKPALDHPLALIDSPSRWRRYWSDQEIFDQVNKDVFRTRPGMDFFYQEGDSRLVTPRGNAATLSVLSKEGPTSPKKLAFKAANIVSPKSHYDRMARILFLFSKLNFGYIQGMNEILAPIYYSFFHDVLEGHFVEADSFWALSAVMTEQRDIFCSNLDESSIGMYARLGVIQSLLKKLDPEVSTHLSKIGVKFDFFALRWIMLLFAQEFDIPAIQVLWDAIFSDHNPGSRFTAGSTSSPVRESLLVHYIAVAMIKKVRTALLDGDFGDAMRNLKQYPPFDASEIVEEAMHARKESFNVNSSILSTGSIDVVAIIAPELHNSPTSRTPKVGESPKKKKQSLSTRFMNFVKRKPKPQNPPIHHFN
jgi:hypothetical protein